MKILYIQDSLGGGGAEKSNADLWYFLQNKGVEIKIMVLDVRKEGVQKEVVKAGFDVHIIKSGSLLSEVNQIKKIIEDFQPDIVHSVLYRAAVRTRFAKLFSKFIHVESLVNCTYAPIRLSDSRINPTVLGLYKKLDQFSQKFGVDHFVAITQEVKSHYMEHLKIDPDRISIVYRGREVNKYISDKSNIRNKVIKRIGLNPDGLIFIHVGRQEFQKGHLDLLKAIKLADKQLFDKGVQFLFCGREGNSTDDIQEFLKKNKIETSIQFLGHRDDIYELLVAADVFVFPSLFEGLGGSLIEAQAAGLPLLCSDISVFEEVVTDENAIFHKTNDPKSLSEKLIQVLEMDREEMGRKSLENYNKNFRLEEVNQKMLDFYEANRMTEHEK